jgi:hypothetical protein
MADKSNSDLLADGKDESVLFDDDLFYYAKEAGATYLDRVIKWQDMFVQITNYVDGEVTNLQNQIDDKLDDSGGTVTGIIDMDNNVISNVGTPTNGGHATTKTYVDSAIASRLPIDGSSPMLDNINLGGFRAINMATPAVGTDGANKDYVDSAATGIKEPSPIDLSSNPNYPASDARDSYRVTNFGRVGGASGPFVEPGSLIVCHTTNAGGTEAAVGANYFILQSNILDASESDKGKIAIATQTETNNGVDDTKAITAEKLNNRTATTTRTGIARIATQGEVDSGTGANTIVTPETLSNYPFPTGASDIQAFEITLTKAQINDLHNTSVPITAADLGLSAHKGAKILRDFCEVAVYDDGTPFVAIDNRVIEIVNDYSQSVVVINTGLIETPYGAFHDLRNATLAGIRIANNTGFNIEATGAITGGGDNSFIKIKLFYQLTDV